MTATLTVEIIMFKNRYKNLSVIYLLLLHSSLALSKSNQWEKVSSIYPAPAEAIGSYANGCLAGAAALPLKGEGFQVIRSQRHRFYGHPYLVDFITDYAKKLKTTGVNNILIGDMSMPRGGKFSYGHSSHQIGLDVDIWLRLTNKPLTDNELTKPYAVSVVDKESYTVNPDIWSTDHKRMLKLAAQDTRVARIFVNPVIKQKLCDQRSDNDTWLQKIRPWWGHSKHMHVRLHCPEGSDGCIEQKPLAKGHGCGELAWWKAQLTKPPSVADKHVPKPIKIKPVACTKLIDGI